MTDPDKPSFIERIGAHVGMAADADAEKIAIRRDGERRLQTYLIGIVATVVSALLVSAIATLAMLPGQFKLLSSEFSESRNALAATLARIEHRIDAGNDKDVEHDATLSELARRVSRTEYVIAIAPATAQYAAAAAASAPAPKKPPAHPHGKAIVPSVPKVTHDD